MENINYSIFNPKDKLSENKPDEVKIYIYPPFEEKQIAIENYAKWDVDNKKWFITSKDNMLYEKYRKKNLKNIYIMKDIYKKTGGKWNAEQKYWFTYNTNEKLKEYFI